MNLSSNPRATMALCVVTLTFLFHSGHAGAQSVQGGGRIPTEVCHITVSGDIDASTLASVGKQYNAAQNPAPKLCIVSFDSLGGDVDLAIKIGQFLRARHATTIVPANAKCASACVLAFLGGVNRLAVGRIGIHRPYSLGLSTSVVQSESSYSRVNELVKSYFVEMNVPEDLLTAMNGIPPDEVMWLDASESARFHITGDDPAWADYQDSRTAQALGISKTTLYERRNLAKQLCANEQDPVHQWMCTSKVIRDGVR